MRSDWKELSINELKADKKNAIAMGPFGSRIKAENFKNIGVPVIKGQNLNTDFIDESKYDYLTEEKADELKTANVYPLDILITHRGTIGQVGLIPTNSKYKRYVISQSLLKVSLDKDKMNPYYLYYFFKSRLGKHRLLMNASQVGVPAIAQASTSVKKILVPHPNLESQDKIVKILLSLDKKIELNRKMNQTLEEMAQALFKSWFVDFDPVHARANSKEFDDVVARELGISEEALKLFPSVFVESELGLIPEGWEVKSLDKIAHYQNGLALQRFRPKDEKNFLPVLKIAQLKKGYADGVEKADPNIKSECIVDSGDVVFSWSGTLVVDIWCGGTVALNQHLFKVTSNDYPKWFYYYWTKNHLSNFQKIASDKAVTMGHIKRSHLAEAFCLIPSQLIFDEAEKMINPLLEKIILNRFEINFLQKTRDALLPKLLSGELDVSKIEEINI